MISARLISRLTNIDWDFAGAFSESAFSAIHWHPGRFASQIPASVIGLLSEPDDLVLDPFAGSGTTLVEAQRLARRSIGIDISPVSCLVTRAKTLGLTADKIAVAAHDLIRDATASLGAQRQLRTPEPTRSHIPPNVQTKWYTRSAIARLGSLWGLIQSFKGTKRLLAETAFSASLLPVCRETRHWGYVCDNSTPKADHEGDVLVEFIQTLSRLRAAYEERDRDIVARFSECASIREAKVICGSAAEALKTMPADFVDLVVTSPPYFGVCDYAKSQRLSMEWFGHEIEICRLQEIGARSKRHRAAAREEYVSELMSIFAEAKRLLRRHGVIAVVVGQSKTRDSVLGEIRNGLRLLGMNLDLDLNRRVSSQRRQAPSIKGEHVFLLSV